MPFDHVANRILGAANGILHFALRLIRIAFRLDLGVASRFADLFLDRAFRLVGCAFYPILVRKKPLPMAKNSRLRRPRRGRPGILLP